MREQQPYPCEKPPRNIAGRRRRPNRKHRRLAFPASRRHSSMLRALQEPEDSALWDCCGCAARARSEQLPTLGVAKAIVAACALASPIASKTVLSLLAALGNNAGFQGIRHSLPLRCLRLCRGLSGGKNMGAFFNSHWQIVRAIKASPGTY